MKYISFPFVRLLIGFVFIATVYFGLYTVSNHLLKSHFSPSQIEAFKPVIYIIITTIGLFMYWVYFKYIERKEFSEFSKVGALEDVRKGFLYTLIVSVLATTILFLTGNLTISIGNGLSYLPLAFSLAIMSSVLEEILFRGLLFRLTEEKLGSAIAIIISSLLFGIAHLINPGSTILSALAIGLEAGLFLSAIYILTRRLWMNIAIHFTWNFFKSIMGFHYLDNEGQRGILFTKLSGNELLTGGKFGIEFSIVIIGTGIVLGLYFTAIAFKDKKIIKPFWAKSDSNNISTLNKFSQ